MVEVTASTERQDDVTFVWATVRNTRRTPQRVAIENALDGATWPPVTGRMRDPRWQNGTWVETIEPGRCCGVGFSTPAVPDADPVRVVSTERAEDSSSETENAEAVLASLDEWAPPSAVLRRDR
ncbi:hypothetical protein G9C85_04735 [Halorubellus sp. JP-L1]|uniref:DUF7857 domain-containing protein n=1 Tax=Halorubellus sp. JP-L1 TaxID=2715753 RepID=UPI00140BF60D|nr:hypothetical protein [Halorubellus sp. JP-L1]NHN40942.1 hypothetical protein [Halorubellus sp. JP-L1]